MKGDYVIVRAFGDRPLVRRVWDSSAAAVYVCNDQRYTMLMSGEDERYTIGFPRECVYEYNEEVATTIDGAESLSQDLWNSLAVWHGDLDTLRKAEMRP